MEWKAGRSVSASVILCSFQLEPLIRYFISKLYRSEFLLKQCTSWGRVLAMVILLNL